jgi:hypothetical protein
MIDARESNGRDTVAAIKAQACEAAASTHPDDTTIRDRHLAVLSTARGHLVGRCVVAAERLAEGWKPWSVNDVDILIRLGEAITVLDKLVKEKRRAE